MSVKTIAVLKTVHADAKSVASNACCQTGHSFALYPESADLRCSRCGHTLREVREAAGYDD